jgi:hypothetical protein
MLSLYPYNECISAFIGCAVTTKMYFQKIADMNSFHFRHTWYEYRFYLNETEFVPIIWKIKELFYQLFETILIVNYLSMAVRKAYYYTTVRPLVIDFI